jgi:hypothetical protein
MVHITNSVAEAAVTVVMVVLMSCNASNSAAKLGDWFVQKRFRHRAGA